MTTNITTAGLAVPYNEKYLFNRTYALAMGPPNQPNAFQYANFPTLVNGQLLPPAPLRITFDIDKNLIGTSSKSKIEIYNLSVESRNRISSGFILQLQAGYVGLMDTIFLGNVDYQGAKTQRKGPDIITGMECGDGESAIAMTTLNKSYPPGTQLYQVLQDLAGSMHLNSVTDDGGIGTGIVLGIPALTYGRGLTVHGSCKDSLNTILIPLGLRWNVQNGNLNITPVRANNGTEAIVVASGSVTDPTTGVTKFDPKKSTGLIGTPFKSSTYTEFTTLLNPKIVPGCVVQLICENNAINGFYKVMRAHYIGDSHESKWQISCQCTLITQTVQTLLPAQGFDYGKAVVTTGNIA